MAVQNIEMNEQFGETILHVTPKWCAGEVISKKMNVTTAVASATKYVAGTPLTIAATGKTAAVGNEGGAGKVLGVLAEDITIGGSTEDSKSVEAKVIYAGKIYADALLEAGVTADTVAKLIATPGKIVIIEREKRVIYG